jgi:hypothetical protein
MVEQNGLTSHERGQFMAQLGRLGMDSNAVVSASALQKAYGGSNSIQSLRGVISGALGAQHPGDAGEFLEAAARIAPFAQRAGVSEEALLGQLSTVSQATGSSEKAGHELKAMFEHLATHSRTGGVEGLTKRSDAQLSRLLGNGGYAAAKALRNGSQLVKIGDASMLDQMNNAAVSDPTVSAALGLNQADQLNNASLETEGAMRNRARANILAREAAGRSRGDPELFVQIQKTNDEFYANLDARKFVETTDGERAVQALKKIADNTNGIRPPRVNADRDK